MAAGTMFVQNGRYVSIGDTGAKKRRGTDEGDACCQEVFQSHIDRAYYTVYRATLSQNRTHDIARNVRQSEMPALEFICQARVIDTQALQNSRQKIVDVDRVLGDVLAVIVGFPE